MSTLKVTNIQSNAAGFNDVVSFQNSGGTQNGTLCRAFINFNGTGVIAPRASFNVSEITDNGTGDYIITLTNALTDANFTALSTSGNNVFRNPGANTIHARTTTSLRVIHYEDNEPLQEAYDVEDIDVAVFR